MTFNIIKEIKEFYSQFKVYWKNPSRIFDSAKKKLFFTNIGVTGLQNISYNLMILITVPFLIRVVGPNEYSKFLFILSFLSLIDVIIDYGFYFTGVRTIANSKDDTELRNNFYSIIQIKAAIFFICAILIVIIGSYTNFLKYDLSLYLSGLILVVGNNLFLGFYYRGKNNFKHYSVANIFANGLMVFLVLIFVSAGDDSNKLVIFQGVSNFIPGSVLLILALSQIKMIRKIFYPDKTRIKYLLNHSFPNASTRLTLSFFFIAHLFIIGQFIEGNVFAAYAISYKVIITVNNFFSAITLPAFSFLVNHDINEDREQIMRFFKIISVGSFLIHVVAFAALFLGELLIFDRILGYHDFHQNYSIHYLIMLFYLLPASINANVNNLLITFKKDSILLRNNIIGIVAFFVFLFFTQFTSDAVREYLIFAGLPLVTLLMLLLNLFSFSLESVAGKQEV